MSIKEDPEHCIFCKIIRGELPSSKIYEDEQIIIIVDLYPVNKGHVLIIPKAHAPYMKDVDAGILADMMKWANKMNAAIRAACKPDGVNLFLADGEAAGQEIFHCHLHVFPRFHNDGFHITHDNRNFQQFERPELDEIAKVLRI